MNERRPRSDARCETRDCGNCQSCRTRRAWAEGRYDDRRPLRRGDAWTPEHEDLLREIAGTVPIEELCDLWEQRTGIRRTRGALVMRAKRLDISLWSQGWSLRDVMALFRVHHTTVLRHWVASGELVGTRWSGRGRHRGWWFVESDVERFIRGYPWRYDRSRMAPTHRLTRVAEVIHRADPWLTWSEAARVLEISTTKLDVWRNRGLVPVRRRPGAGAVGQQMVRGRDLPQIRAAIETARRIGRERATEIRRETFRSRPRDARGHVMAA